MERSIRKCGDQCPIFVHTKYPKLRTLGSCSLSSSYHDDGSDYVTVGEICCINDFVSKETEIIIWLLTTQA